VLAIAMAASTAATARSCILADPTPTPLTVRATPRGQIVATIADGTVVGINSRRGRWAHISWPSGHPIGRVFRSRPACC
jgi:hypothetical protein